MVVLITWKNEEVLIKNESARVVTTLNINFQMLIGSLLHSQRWGGADIQIIQALMVVLVTYKNVKDPENSGVVTTYIPLLVYGDISRCSSADNSAVLGSSRNSN